MMIQPCLHDLRHSYIPNPAVKGVPPQVVQENTGHEFLETIRRLYSHLDSRVGRS